MHHKIFMHRCLELAAQGRGLVGGNPLVGSVLVRGETIIAEGYYQGVGTDHAEVNMIKNCEQVIQPTDRLYVNLEPCNHTGKTPPCTKAIIEAGIKHVVFGMVDPDERVAGQGIEALQAAGVTVEGPVCRAECERLNRGYISLRTKGRPYITLKKAQTMDGRVANTDGTKLCITSPQQNQWSHTYLRTTHDAILVGVQTVITDDPQLTIRNTKYKIQNTKQPKKIILDPELRIPPEAKLLGEGAIVIRDSKETQESQDAKEEILREKGVIVLHVPMINNHFDWDELWSQLQTANCRPASILVEGGPQTWDAFYTAGLVDEEVLLLGA